MPPRPRLSYGVEQRRTIEGELVRDRENAAHVAAAVDYELGRTDVPAPPPPVPSPPVEAGPGAAVVPIAPAVEQRPGGPGDSPLAEAYVEDAMFRAKDRGKLKDFLRKLERPAPGAEDAPSAAGVLGLEAPAPAPAAEAAPIPEASVAPAAGAANEPSPPPGRPSSAALDHFGGHLGGILGVEGVTHAAATPVPTRREALQPTTAVTRLAFAPGSRELPAAAEAGLARALAAAREAGARLHVAGGDGSDAGLGIDRARAVALALMRLGAKAGMLEVAGGGSGEPADEVRVSLVGRS